MLSMLSIKIKTLILFMAAIALVATTSLVVTTFQTNELGDIQLQDEEKLILEQSRHELKAYTMMAEKAISAFYEMSLDKNIGQKVKDDALVFKKIDFLHNLTFYSKSSIHID